MVRVWFACALLVAALVAGVLVLTSEGSDPENGPRRPKPPSPLAEKELRLYLEVTPQILGVLQKYAELHTREMIATQGKVDEQALGMRSQAEVDTLLEKYHLTRETWRLLSERVEYAVNVLRTEDATAARRAEIEEELALKRELLSKVTRPEDRAKIEEEIRAAEAKLSPETLPLLDRDKELVRQYWRDLNRVVPQRGAPPK